MSNETYGLAVCFGILIGGGCGFGIGYVYCRIVLRDICLTEAGEKTTRRIFGELPLTEDIGCDEP